MHTRYSILPKQIPVKFRDLMMDWEILIKSPYSHSYYNMYGKTWTETPLGITRVSDHWNFKNNIYNRNIQCPTDIKVENKKWSMGTWDGEKFIISDTLPKETEENHREWMEIMKFERKLFNSCFGLFPNFEKNFRF